MGLHKGKPKDHREPAYQRAWMRTTLVPCPVPGLVDDCWIFSGSSLRGYGQIHREGKTEYVHHVGFEYLRGERNRSLETDHLCRVPMCWNPWHLEEVTHEENVRRGLWGNYQREKTHCPQGHEYTPENTYRPPSRPYNRTCRECRRIDSLRRYRAKRSTK